MFRIEPYSDDCLSFDERLDLFVPFMLFGWKEKKTQIPANGSRIVIIILDFIRILVRWIPYFSIDYFDFCAYVGSFRRRYEKHVIHLCRHSSISVLHSHFTNANKRIKKFSFNSTHLVRMNTSQWTHGKLYVNRIQAFG